MSGKRSLRDILSEVPDTDPSLLQNMIKSRGDLNQSSTLKGSASMDRISARQSLRPSGSFLSVQADSRKRTDSIVSARSVGSLTSGRSVGSLTASKLTQTRLALMKGELELHFELITEMLLDEVQPGYNPLLVIKWRKSKWVNAVKGVGSTGTTDTLKRRMYSSWFVSNEELQDYLSTRLTIHHQNLASQTTSRIEPQLALDGGTDLLLQFLADPEPSVLSRQSLEPSPRPFQDSVSHSSAKQHPSITQDTESASVDSDVLQNDSKSHIMDTAYRDTTQRSSFAHNKALLLTDNVKPHPIASTPVSKPSKALSSKASSFTSVSKASEAYSRNYRPLPANLGLHVSIATQSKPELPSSPPRLPQEQQLELTKTDEKILAKLGNVSKQVLDLNHHFYSAEQNLKIFKNNFRLLEIKLNPASSPAPSKSSPSQPLRKCYYYFFWLYYCPQLILRVICL